MRKRVFVLCMLIGMLVAATSASAITGTGFTFDQTVNGSGNSWSFTPVIPSGPLPITIDSGYLSLAFTYTPSATPFFVNIAIITPTLNSYYTGDTFSDLTYSSGPISTTWNTTITNPAALQAIGSGHVQVVLNPNVGTINSIGSGRLYGTGHVAPEPVSMALVGFGMVGLPVAGRFRRFIKKNS